MALLPVRRNPMELLLNVQRCHCDHGCPKWAWLLDTIRGYKRVEHQWLKTTYPNTQLWCIGWLIKINFIKFPIFLCFTVLILRFAQLIASTNVLHIVSYWDCKITSNKQSKYKIKKQKWNKVNVDSMHKSCCTPIPYKRHIMCCLCCYLFVRSNLHIYMLFANCYESSGK